MFRRNTGSQTVYGVVVNASTGAGETTGVAVTVSKDGAAGASGTGTVAHISGGLWAYTFSADELNATAVGFVFTKPGAVPVGGTVRTTQANPDDSVRLGLSALPNATPSTSGGLPVFSDLPTAVNNAAAVWNTLTAAMTATGSIGQKLALFSLDASGRVTPVPSSLAAAFDSQGYTTARAALLDRLDVAVSTRLAASGYVSPASSGVVASAVRTELATELARIDAAISSRATQTSVNAVSGFVDTEVAAILAIAQKLDTALELDGAVYRFTTNALEQAPVGGGGGGATAAQVWDYLTSALTTNGSIGKLIVDNLNATVSSRLASASYTAAPTASQNATAVRSELATELGRLDVSTSSRLASTDYTAPTTPPTASQNATAVRAELSTELGRIDVATSTRLSSAAYTAPANSDVAAIKAKTDTLPASPAGVGDPMSLAVNSVNAAALAADAVAEVQAGLATSAQVTTLAGYVDTEVAAIKAKTDLIPNSPAAVGDPMTLAPNSVNASALAADAVAEIQSGLGGGGGATPAEIWDHLLSSISTPGSIGGLIKDNLDVAVSSVSVSVSGATPEGLINALKSDIDFFNLLATAKDFSFTPPTAYPGPGTLAVGDHTWCLIFDKFKNVIHRERTS